VFFIPTHQFIGSTRSTFMAVPAIEIRIKRINVKILMVLSSSKLFVSCSRFYVSNSRFQVEEWVVFDRHATWNLKPGI